MTSSRPTTAPEILPSTTVPLTTLTPTIPTSLVTTMATATLMMEETKPKMISRYTQWKDPRQEDMSKKIKQEIHRAIQKQKQRENRSKFRRIPRPATTLPAAALNLHVTAYLSIPSAPVGFAPVQQAPAGYTPVQQAPAGYVPISSAPVQQAPAGYVPVSSAPAGYVPAPFGPTGYVPAPSGPAGYMPFYK
ncbi:PREDICTED: proline-rich protein 27-like isoform X2 [Acromyrmex echinatior]|nr:PREDICTED: proline-rich protein 27-like isoform X2 [Acromyrmex echinatior]